MIHDAIAVPGSGTRAQPHAADEGRSVRTWVRVLANYREPFQRRSALELLVTLVPFFALWGLAWWSLSVNYPLAVALAVLNGGFLVRLFAIQHDCGHGSFFKSRTVNDWVGRALGVLTLTPYAVWRRTHALHHASAGNHDKREMGDVLTLTVASTAPFRLSGGCATGFTGIRWSCSVSARPTCSWCRTGCRRG